MTPGSDEWRAQVQEEPLEPERPLVDAHHHLWDYPDNRYLFEELTSDCRAHSVRQTVYVECLSEYYSEGPASLRPVGETAFVQCEADRAAHDGAAVRVAAAISSFANLQLGESVATVLAAHREASPERLRGIRHACGWDDSVEIHNSHSNPPAGLYLRDDFRAGFAQLELHDLLFESWGFHTQLGELLSLAQSFPRITIVLNHVGGPLGIGRFAGQQREVFANWQRDIVTLARCPNVWVKLGGLAMPINGFGWHRRERPADSFELQAAFEPYFDHCIHQFGVERCLFESNFPVDRASCSYTVLWNAFKRIAAKYSLADQDGLLHANALALYRLPEDP
ncbi:MAG: amidohydrolase family protein [Pseudomonadota bacterium]